MPLGMTVCMAQVHTSAIVRTDLLQGLRLRGCIDLAIFNPPYVVTPPEVHTAAWRAGSEISYGLMQEMEGYGISVAWAGGAHGRQVIDRFMPLIPVRLCLTLLGD